MKSFVVYIIIFLLHMSRVVQGRVVKQVGVESRPGSLCRRLRIIHFWQIMEKIPFDFIEGLTSAFYLLMFSLSFVDFSFIQFIDL